MMKFLPLTLSLLLAAQIHATATFSKCSMDAQPWFQMDESLKLATNTHSLFFMVRLW